MKKILIPIDFSSAAINALRVGAQLAVRADAGLYLLHVNELFSYMNPVSDYAYTISPDDIERYDQEATERLQNLSAELLSELRFSKLNIQGALRQGRMIQVVREIAADEKIDLIVMGTLGASGWKEAFLGSNTERVIRHTRCPVLVIPETTIELKFKKVLLPSTLQADQKNVFKIVKAWQDLLDFEVEILYLNDPLKANSRSSIELEANRLIEQAGLQKVTLQLYSQTLNEEGTIRAYSAKSNADLIAMGTHQRLGLSHLLFGSMTENTANHADIPVLAVPLGQSINLK